MKKYRIIKHILFDEYAKESETGICAQELIKKTRHVGYKWFPFFYKEEEYWDWEYIGKSNYEMSRFGLTRDTIPTKFGSETAAEDFLNRIAEGVEPNSRREEVIKEIEL